MIGETFQGIARTFLISSSRYLMLGILLPLLLSQFWIATIRDGMLFAIRCCQRHIARVLAPQSFLI